MPGCARRGRTGHAIQRLPIVEDRETMRLARLVLGLLLLTRMRTLFLQSIQWRVIALPVVVALFASMIACSSSSAPTPGAEQPNDSGSPDGSPDARVERGPVKCGPPYRSGENAPECPAADGWLN